MRIEVKGRNLPVSDELREHVSKRFRKVSRQVSELAELEVEVFEERNPAIADSQVAEATLHLKRATLRAGSSSRTSPQNWVRRPIISPRVAARIVPRRSGASVE